MRILFLCFFVPLMCFSQDVITRARQSAYLPNLHIRYSVDQDFGQVIWASLDWDLESIFGSSLILDAIKIKRLEREKIALIQINENLDVKEFPTFD